MEHYDRNVLAQLEHGMRTPTSYVNSPRAKGSGLLLLRSSLCIGFIAIGISLWFIDIRPILLRLFSAETLQSITPFIDANLHYSLASVLVTLASLLLYLSIRRYYGQACFWSDSCPDCINERLVRYRRERRHYILATVLQLPVRHFGCTQCSWRGARIDRTRFQ